MASLWPCASLIRGALSAISIPSISKIVKFQFSNQVKQREQENPDQIDKVPVEADVFGVWGEDFSAGGLDEQQRQGNYAADDVQAVYAGEGEIAGEENVLLRAIPHDVVHVGRVDVIVLVLVR